MTARRYEWSTRHGYADHTSEATAAHGLSLDDDMGARLRPRCSCGWHGRWITDLSLIGGTPSAAAWQAAEAEHAEHVARVEALRTP